MRRLIAMMGVLGLVATGLGCQHVAGKCDCGAHPSDAIMTPPNPPYPTAPVAGTPVKPILVPTPMPKPGN